MPVAIKDDRKKTDSLLLVTWRSRDESDPSYSIEPRADRCLGEDGLDTASIPPGAIRSGLLLFQVREGVQDHQPTFEGIRNQAGDVALLG